MKNLKILFLLLLISIACTQKVSPSQEKIFGVRAPESMVVSAHPLASQAGIDILKKGGNAFDAAVAVHFALTVVFPEAGNIGGGGFAVIREANGEYHALDFREKAPENATRDMYLDNEGNVITEKSRLGHQAAGVPGSVDGMWKLHQKLGKLPWEELLKPSIKLAFEGHELTEYAAANLNEDQEEFKKANRYEPWVIKSEGWKKGDISIQKELASTLTSIQNEGREGFYGGIVADQIVKEMQLGGGLITQKDLTEYSSKWRQPIKGTYRDYQVIAMPPPSSGGIALLQLLQGAEKYDIKKMGHNTPETIHLMTELERRVYADRATHLGDPDYYEVPVEMLLDPSYNQQRFSSIVKNKRTPSSDIKEGKVEIIESVETTHFSIVDKERNAIAVTTTLNGYYGCKVMVRGAGFFLNNEMDDFSAKPGIPNMFGLVGAEANAIAPGKRMLSSMTPTLLEKDNQLFMVTGTPGGSTIITSVFQNILNVVDHGMTLQEAVNARRLHSQWLPDVILSENGAITEDTRKKLESMGHKVENRGNWGKLDAILLLPDGRLEGAADTTRGDDSAIGY